MLAKTNEALIAQAQEAARNKFATSHVNAAHARLIEALINNPPPAFEINPTSDTFEATRDYLTTLAAAFDDVVYQVMREAASNSNSIGHVNSVLITNALHDADVTTYLINAAEVA